MNNEGLTPKSLPYKKTGFNLPERAWNYSGIGLKIDRSEIQVSEHGEYLEKQKKETNPLKSPPSSNGIIFNINIYKGGEKSFIQDYSFITVYYSVNQEEIRKNIELYRKLYPEGVE